MHALMFIMFKWGCQKCTDLYWGICAHFHLLIVLKAYHLHSQSKWVKIWAEKDWRSYYMIGVNQPSAQSHKNSFLRSFWKATKEISVCLDANVGWRGEWVHRNTHWQNPLKYQVLNAREPCVWLSFLSELNILANLRLTERFRNL